MSSPRCRIAGFEASSEEMTLGVEDGVVLVAVEGADVGVEFVLGDVAGGGSPESWGVGVDADIVKARNSQQ